MSFTPKPCLHCASKNFHVLPNVQIELDQSISAFGLPGRKTVGHWNVTLMLCAQCGRTEIFTGNGPELAQKIGGSYPASCP